MKRLCIYVTYDKQNIIDRYIGFMLKELNTCVNHMIVVCNETKIVRGLEILKTYADEIFYRENIGYDAGAFKDAMCNLLGWEKVLAYDELVLVNDSFFGPFRPMKDIFSEMEQKKADFWGLAKAEYGAWKANYGKDVPEHIQTYFMVVRSRMLHGKEFQKYWEELPYYNVFSVLYKEYEFKFTLHFKKLGYTYDTLADTKANDSDNKINNYCQYSMISYELIRDRNFPFLKKQQIANDTMAYQTQEQIRLAIEYIDKNTDYNIDFIWENLIRTLNIADLQRNFCLRYVVSQEEESYIFQGSTIIAVFVSHKEAVEPVSKYLERLQGYYDIKIFSKDLELRNLYQRLGFLCVEIDMESISDIFEELACKELVCVVHDVDLSSIEQPNYIGKSYFYNIWENLLKEKRHVQKIINYFAKDSKLGLLVPPKPLFAQYFGDLGKGWNENFEIVQKCIENMKLNCQIIEERAPFCVSNNFWVRGSILRRLRNLQKKDYQYLPYMWSYMAQDAGCYSGIVESAVYAAMNEVNLQYCLEQILEQIRYQCGDFEDLFTLKKIIFRTAFSEFRRRCSHIFVYGTGYMAKAFHDLLGDIEAYVVSDGREKQDYWEGKPVKYLSEIAEVENCGIVLCLDEKNQLQVIPFLEKYGIKNYLRI